MVLPPPLKEKNIMKKFIVTIAFVIVLFACNSKPKDCNKEVFRKSIPEYRMDSSIIKIGKKIESLAGLESLENGYKDIQIRIWFSYSGDVEHLIILKKMNGNWSGSLSKLQYVYGGKRDTLVSIKRDIKIIHPKSEWKTFIDSLYKLDISTLPDITLFQGYSISHDGYWFTVEIADCNSYKIYSYNNPMEYANNFSPANNVIAICRLIENQLDFRCELLHPQ